MEWISVEDRLPKEEGFYITKFGNGFIGENWFLMFDDSKEPKWYHDESVLGGIKYWAEADFVQVVRCKDCKYSYAGVSSWCCSYGVFAGCIMPGDFYCKCGVRKEGQR